MRVKLLPYKMGSKSARALANKLNIKKLYTDERSRFRPRSTDLIINWGSTQLPQWRGGDVPCFINLPFYVEQAADKLKFFEWSQGLFDENGFNNLKLVEYTTSKDSAIGWVRDGHKVVQRAILNGRSGQGITIAETVEDIIDVPLYTKYVKKKHEFRVHVIYGEVVDVQQKRRMTEEEPLSYEVRSRDNGWVYCRQDVSIPVHIKRECARFVTDFGLDFGALDIIWNEHYNKWRILEVNTAPGLEGTTLETYAIKLTEMIEDVESAVM